MVALVVLALAALWLAGEEHYRGCVEAAVAKNPPGLDFSTSSSVSFGYESGPPLRDAAGLNGSGISSARKAVTACSRLPF